MSIPGSNAGNLELIEKIESLEEAQNFSFKEKRIGTWINGKPLYRKIITQILDFPATPSFQTYAIQHNVPDIDKTIDVSLVIQDSNGGLAYKMPFFNSNGACETHLRGFTNSQTVILNKSNWSGHVLMLEIKYTKTTD